MIETAPRLPKLLAKYAQDIDHMAIAVPNLESSISFYRDLLGFDVVEKRETKGRRTAMVSAVMRAKDITLVLIQGTSPESQVSKYVNHYGPGVQHIAISVEDIENCVEELTASGVDFDTTVIRSPGLRQIFTKRDPESGMMIELIERLEEDADFSDEGVQQLFDQLESSDAY
jgi:methylmalonyl-CoA epimerase